ncbi:MULTISPECIES: hypothetical protein [unclassified Pseudomonas]|uniref:hypothetical protein n=1 Tax=unclassified Pseudomonas TaxID=196821 RepID=UPI001F599099|nr:MULTISPECIES: hypothetical protein [unclassified Pseudomonas]
MNSIEFVQRAVDLQGLMALTKKNYRFYEKETPLENLSDFEVLAIRCSLNAVEVDDVIAYLEKSMGVRIVDPSSLCCRSQSCTGRISFW